MFDAPKMDVAERWQYYISSYMRLEPTEGVPRSRMQKSVLGRNLPSLDPEVDQSNMPNRVVASQELASSICVLSFKTIWRPGTSEYFIYDRRPSAEEARQEHAHLQQRLTQHREARLKEAFVHNNSWMKGLSQDEVQQAKNAFQTLVDGGPLVAGGEADVEMAS